MSKQVREKIALLVFAVLVVLGGCVLASYLYTGRTWTQAATLVDDTLGNMQGYTGIVFNGVVPPEPEDDPALSSEPSSTGGTVAEMVRLTALPLVERAESGRFDGVFLSDVREIYEQKGAKVITLDVRDLAGHAEPVVYRAGDKRIGVFSATSFLRAAEVEHAVSTLKEQGADSIVCLAPREALLATSKGIDILLLTEDAATNDVRTAEGTTTVVQSPTTGEVGVILLSTNNVALVREIDSL